VLKTRIVIKRTVIAPSEAIFFKFSSIARVMNDLNSCLGIRSALEVNKKISKGVGIYSKLIAFVDFPFYKYRWDFRLNTIRLIKSFITYMNY
jgi:hypothetical protein